MCSAASLALCSFTTLAANKHVHGHGQLLIAQDDSQWQLAFSIPAADLLGFEHEPEGQAQREKLYAIEAAVGDFNNVVRVGGHCQVSSQDIDIPYAEHRNAHNSHKGQAAHEEHAVPEGHDNHSDHENHSKHEAHQHNDISLAYTLSCSDSISAITIRMFEFAPSLSSLEVQWINDKGQGMTDVTPQAATINW